MSATVSPASATASWPTRSIISTGSSSEPRTYSVSATPTIAAAPERALTARTSWPCGPGRVAPRTTRGRCAPRPPRSQVDQLELDRVPHPADLPRRRRVAPEERVRIHVVAEPVEVRAVLPQRRHAAVDGRGHVHVVRRRRCRVHQRAPHTRPRLEPLVAELGEHPAVPGITRRVERGLTHDPVVGHVDAAEAPP